ncbi:hypothetical protein GCM10027020_01450 [Nocardioides salsibiostraticola]
MPIVIASSATAGEKGPKPGTFRGGALIQDGWWARTNEPPPETGLAQPPSVPAVAAPEDALLVALINGDPERITALEFGLKGGDDTIVDEVLLALAESDERGANVNSELANLQACPVTESFWVGVDNGAWKTAPVYDCETGAAPGVRSDEGVWTFDLTALASGWTASDSMNSPAVVLVGTPAADPAQGASSFQVGFDGEKGIGLAAKVTRLPAENTDGGEEGEAEGLETPDAASGGSGTGETTGSGSSGGFGGVSSSGDLGSSNVDPISVPDSSAVEGAAGLEDTGAGFAPEEADTRALVSAPIGSAWYSGLGIRAILLAAVVLMLSYLVMVAMGGAGQPTVGGRRRGVGRALERLRATPDRIVTLEDRT